MAIIINSITITIYYVLRLTGIVKSLECLLEQFARHWVHDATKAVVDLEELCVKRTELGSFTKMVGKLGVGELPPRLISIDWIHLEHFENIYIFHRLS